jgi:hypothetical protein
LNITKKLPVSISNKCTTTTKASLQLLYKSTNKEANEIKGNQTIIYITASMTDSAVTITEKITFTDGHEVNRTMPIILNNGRLSLNTWNKFCNECDEALKPLKNVKVGLTTLWFLIIIFFILMGTGWLWSDNFDSYYGIIAPLTVVTFILMCKFESYMKQKVESKLMRICADVSNHDKNLAMTLTSPTDLDVKVWYITVVLSNANDMINNTNTDYNDIEATQTPIIVTATAVPVNATASSTVPVPVSSTNTEAPKKYIKDVENPGALTLNPEYKVWMKANGN